MKNKILKILTAINSLVLILGIVTVDSISLIPSVAVAISGLYLLIFVKANERGVNDNGRT